MEEGEIVEDEGFGADIEKRKTNSEVESGEINAIEVHREFDKHNMVGSHVTLLFFLVVSLVDKRSGGKISIKL